MPAHRYREIREEGDDGDVWRRVRVVKFEGEEWFVVRWTTACSGCLESDSGTVYFSGGFDPKLGITIGAGCDECGYTGKRADSAFIPFHEMGDMVRDCPGRQRNSRPKVKDSPCAEHRNA